jgi:hypothetical protein
MKPCYNLLTIQEYINNQVSESVYLEIAQHFEHCAKCRDNFLYLSMLSQSSDDAVPLFPPPDEHCPADEVLIALMMPDHETQARPTEQRAHISNCEHCQERLADLVDDLEFIELFERSNTPLPTAAKIDAVVSAAPTWWLSDRLMAIGRKLRQILRGDTEFYLLYPRLAEYAMILVLIFLTAFGTFWFFETSIREQLGIITQDQNGHTAFHNTGN